MRLSEKLYRTLLLLYPKSFRNDYEEEMVLVFHEALYESKQSDGNISSLRFWWHIVTDALLNAVRQQWRKRNGDRKMTTKKDIFDQNKIFIGIGIGTGILLLIPLLAMQFSNDVNWGVFDFAVVGILVAGMASLFVLAARKFRSRRWLIAVLFGFAFLYIYAELAIGIFTNLGS